MLHLDINSVLTVRLAIPSSISAYTAAMRYTHFRILIPIVLVSFCLIFCNFGKRHVDNSSRIHISEVQSFTQVHVEYVEILSVGIVRRNPKSTLVRLRAAPKTSAKLGRICICARYAPRGDF